MGQAFLKWIELLSDPKASRFHEHESPGINLQRQDNKTPWKAQLKEQP